MNATTNLLSHIERRDRAAVTVAVRESEALQ